MISHIMTLANGIIGVSVLAMPFCFKQCGIILATLVLILSSILSRLSCYFLIKSAVMSRRRNYEFLAFHAFGPMGKFLVELCVIGFLLGTCIAFFVVVGDLGPQIIGEMIDKQPEDIRTSLLITTGFFIVLPLGLLRNIDSLASISTASIGFYIFLVLRVMMESTHHIFAGDWLSKIHYWRPAGILQCLPIFALSLFCQTQLFEIYEVVPNVSLEKMNEIVRGALNMCTTVYFCVGFFGYIAFSTQSFTGNILMSFEPSLSSEIIKIGFVLSVAFSFPLVIFPCRASLNSLLFRRAYTHETSTTYISEARFRCLTTVIVTIALIIGILIPNIEFVLGIVGSTIGVIICLIFPAAFFISISTKNTNERLLAQFLIVVGMWILILGTYANLYALEHTTTKITMTTANLPSQLNEIPKVLINNEIFKKLDEPIKDLDVSQGKNEDVEKTKPKDPDKLPDSENIRQEPPVPVERLSDNEKPKDNENIRQEPPVPVERLSDNEKPKDDIKGNIAIKSEPIIPELPKVEKSINLDNKLIEEAKVAYDSLKKIKSPNDVPNVEESNALPLKTDEKINVAQKNDVIAVDAIKKEETELAADKEISNVDAVLRKEQLERTLDKHTMEDKEMKQELKELLIDIEQIKEERELERKNEIEKQKRQQKLIQNTGKNEKPVDAAQMPNEVNTFGKSKVAIDKLELQKDTEIKVVENQVKNNLPAPEELKQLKIQDNNQPQLDERVPVVYSKLSNDNKSAIDDLNKQEVNNKYFEENKGNIEMEKPVLSPNLSDAIIDKRVKKSEDHIIKALTKQTNKLSNENETAEVNKLDELRALEEKKEKEEKNRKPTYVNPIPILLKMNNISKQLVNNSKNTYKNLSSILTPKRDILEKHVIEKRDAEEEPSNISSKIVSKTSEHTSNLIVHKDKKNESESCNKKVNESVAEKRVEDNEKHSDKSAESLIKTSSYLSQQDTVKKLSIVSESSVSDSFVKVKTRDLKALEFKDDINDDSEN